MHRWLTNACAQSGVPSSVCLHPEAESTCFRVPGLLTCGTPTLAFLTPCPPLVSDAPATAAQKQSAIEKSDERFRQAVAMICQSPFGPGRVHRSQTRTHDFSAAALPSSRLRVRSGDGSCCFVVFLHRQPAVTLQGATLSVVLTLFHKRMLHCW